MSGVLAFSTCETNTVVFGRRLGYVAYLCMGHPTGTSYLISVPVSFRNIVINIYDQLP